MSSVQQLLESNELNVLKENGEKCYKNRDYSNSLKFFEKSGPLGDGESYNKAGYQHQEGLGTEKNETKAIHFFTEATKLKNVESFLKLGNLYEKKKNRGRY